MEFAYGAVPSDPIIPHTSLVVHTPHKRCDMGDMLYLLIADLGRNPIPYVALNMDEWVAVIAPTEHERQIFEHGLRMMLPLYIRGRN